MENIIKILDITIWPLVVITAMFLFRNDFSKALRRITSVETSVAKMMFEEEMREVELRISDDYVEPSKESAGWLAEMLEIAEISPRAAIMESWTAIEIACVELGLVQGTAVRARFSSSALENYLKDIPNFDNELIGRVMDLRKLRNRVTHGMDADFEFIDAKKYIQVADKTLSILNKSK